MLALWELSITHNPCSARGSNFYISTMAPSSPAQALAHRVTIDIWLSLGQLKGFPSGSTGKESACNAGDPGLILGQEVPWRRDRLPTPVFLGFPGGLVGKKNPPAVWEIWVRPLGWEDFPWRRERLPTPVFCLREFHQLYSLWDHKESDTTERLSLHFTSLHLSCIWNSI